MNFNCFLHFHTFCLSLTSHSIASSFSWWHRVEEWGAYWFSRQTSVEFWRLFHSIGAPLGLQCGKWAHPITKGNEKKPFSDEISYIFSFFPRCDFSPQVFSHISIQYLRRVCLILFGTSQCLPLFSHLSNWTIHQQPIFVPLLHDSKAFLALTSVSFRNH